MRLLLLYGKTFGSEIFKLDGEVVVVIIVHIVIGELEGILIEFIRLQIIVHQFIDDRLVLVGQFRIEILTALVAAKDMIAEVDPLVFDLHTALGANTEIHSPDFSS
jgi:hypothetical protein